MSNKVILACSVCLNRNYSTYKNQTTTLERLEVKKFCKHCNSHTLHRETK
ncbi:50S ribosomal protein L33 [Ornithinibacillus sp. 4-3]|uniref:Large ribosomal subunit protein bL33 n=1 Tax=Ornithinibacillus sp. 4-3 TaxID=3231488 RepID=A0AB39HRA3_9BACI